MTRRQELKQFLKLAGYWFLLMGLLLIVLLLYANDRTRSACVLGILVVVGTVAPIPYIHRVLQENPRLKERFAFLVMPCVCSLIVNPSKNAAVPVAWRTYIVMMASTAVLAMIAIVVSFLRAGEE